MLNLAKNNYIGRAIFSKMKKQTGEPRPTIPDPDEWGYLYTVRFNARVDELLDWEKTIADQSDYAKLALSQIDPVLRENIIKHPRIFTFKDSE